MASFDWLGSSGEMAALIKAKDWAKTPLGSPEKWSLTLRMTIKFILANRFPVLLWWGPDYVQFYNDAYIPIPGAKHPRALGQRGSDCWQEIWPILQPLVDTPFRGGPASWSEDLELDIRRSNFIEETHFTIAYSPVPDDTVVMGIGGVLATVHEITEQVVSARRVAILRDLSARAMEAKTQEQSCVVAAEILQENPKDIPFALVYLLDAEGKKARLEGNAGVAAGQEISPTVIDLGKSSHIASTWLLEEVLRSEKMAVVENIDKIFKQAPKGRLFDPPNRAAVLPIRSNKAHEYVGVLVAGVSPHLALNQQYQCFLELVATQIATAVANARAFEGERKKAEALAEIDRAKTAFFSNVSHEFRTPLTLMLGPIEDLLSTGNMHLPPAARTQLELASRNGARLLRLVNNLLDFSRVEAGRLQAVYEPTDLGTLTYDLASVFRSAAEKAGLELELDCQTLGEPVFVDRAMWEKIVLNLLSNAFKFTFEGKISVGLTKADDRVELRIRDTGVGIPEKEIPRLFERFRRIENTRSRTHEGSGIGLALVQELIKAHGGTVRAESILGEGTTFVVSIPLGDGHLSAEKISAKGPRTPADIDAAAAYVEEAICWLPDTEESERVEKVAAGSDLHSIVPYQPSADSTELNSRPVIFVADDNADMRQYVIRLLSDAYKVQTFPDGKTALDAIRNTPPDLVLTDVMMPRLDGFGLLRELRADPRTQTIPIILLSARAGEDSRVEGIERGADDYLVKPFTSRELLARVRTHLRMSRLRRQAEAALFQSEQRLRLAMDASQMGFWHRDLITGEVLWSRRQEVIYGYEPGTRAGTLADFANRLHPDDFERVMSNVRKPKEKGTDVLHDFRIVWPDKSVHWIRAFARILYDDRGNPTQLVGMCEDITERKQAEEALRRSEERLRLAIDAANMGSWDLDLKTGINLWNPRHEILWGYEPGNPHRTYEDYENRVHPDDLDHVRAAAQECKEKRNDFFCEYRVVWPDQSVHWVCALGHYLYDSEGRAVRMLGMLEDITQRKESEEAIRINEQKLRRAHKAAHSGAWEWHLDTGQVVWSPEIEFLYGLPQGTFAGNTDAWRKMVHPEDLAKIDRYLAVVYKESSDLRMEFRITRMDGEVRWLEAIGQVIRNQDGNAQLVTGISTDITERKAVEDKLRLTTERFELALTDSSISVFNQDLDLRYTWIYNPALGYQASEMIGKRDTEIFERLEDAEVTESIKLDVIRTGKSRREEVVIRHLSVDRYYDLLIDPLKDSNGTIIGVTCASIDFTERKQGQEALQRSEYRFRTLIESNIVPIVCGNNHLIIEANDAFLQMVGYTRDDLKAGKIDWVKMTPPEHIEKDLKALEHHRNCIFAAPYEKEYFRKNGSRVPVFIGTVVINQAPEEYLCFIVDLSELKRVEAELRKYQRELEEKVSERTLELTLSLAAVGSEIKGRKETEEQLRELSGRLLRLQDEEHRRIARELHDSTGQTLSALKMSLSLLEQHVENIPTGKALLEDLNMLADSAIQEVRTTSHLLHPPMLDEIGFSSAARWYLEGFAKRSGIDTTIEFADLPGLTKDEELALFRVLQESLTNVHRHSGSKRAEVRTYAEGESVILSIRDFGMGIPPEKLEKFNKTGAGVGVGLGGMKQRLHELGGNLEVRIEANGITILAKLRQSGQTRVSHFSREAFDSTLGHE